jgi:hypothetical protein
LTFSSPLSRVTNTISIPVATSSVNGYLSSTDWSTFNGKQDALSGTGFVKISGTTISYDNSTYLTANQTITLSGDVSGSGSTAITTTIGANKVTNSMLSQVATATFKGRTTAGTGDVEDLTGTQATALLDAFSSTLKGLAPASGGGSTNFLRADGSWAAPVGTTYTFSTGLTNTSGTITANLSTGISGGQSIKGGTAASETLRITSTDSGTKGKILFGSSVYDELNERLGLNTAAPIEIFHAVKNSASGAYARIDAINGSPGIITYRANGSVNTPTAVLSGESIGIWSLRGYDGTSYINTSAGYIEGVAAETWTSSRLGTYLTFGTTAIGTSTSQERMRIDNDGNVLIGTTTNGGFKLDVNGTARIVTSLTTPTVQGSTSASGTLRLSSTSNATKGKILFGTSAYDEANNRLGIGTASPSCMLNVVAGTIVDSGNAMLVTATMPTTITAQTTALQYTITGAGSSAFQQNAMLISFAAGYTGSSATVGFNVSNANAGTGTGFISGSSNAGVNAVVSGTTTGRNAGGIYVAQGGDLNQGVLGRAIAAKNSATNIGVVGAGLNTGTTPIFLGGYFTCGTGTPTLTSAALMCDNDTQAVDIFVARDNGTKKWSIADGGNTVWADGVNMVFGAGGAGTQIGGSGNKLAFYGATAIAQQSTSLVTSIAFVANTGTAINSASTFGGYTIIQVIQALKNLGIIA